MKIYYYNLLASSMLLEFWNIFLKHTIFVYSPRIRELNLVTPGRGCEILAWLVEVLNVAILRRVGALVLCVLSLPHSLLTLAQAIHLSCSLQFQVKQQAIHPSLFVKFLLIMFLEHCFMVGIQFSQFFQFQSGSQFFLQLVVFQAQFMWLVSRL